MAQTQTTSIVPDVVVQFDPVANPFKQHDAWWEDDYATSTCKDKGKAVDWGGTDDHEISFDDLYNRLDDIEWKAHDPPDALQWIAECESETVATVIKDSIDRVKDRISEENRAEEERKRQEEAEKARLEQEENERVEQEQNVASEETVAETIPAEAQSPGSLPRSTSLRRPYVTPQKTSRRDLSELRSILAKPKKSRNRSIFSLLFKPDRPESSAAGAARGQFKQPRQLYGLPDVHVPPQRDGENWPFPESADAVQAVPDVEAYVVPDHLSMPTAKILSRECVSCLDDFNVRDMVKAPCHHYCMDCFDRLISTACENEQQWPAKCCLNEIPRATIELVIQGELLTDWRNKGEEWGIPVSDRIYCSEPTCSAWCRPHEINRAQNIARCNNGHQTCTFCRGPQHGNETCPQDRELLRTNELAEEEGWKRCIGCQAFVEHREACQHMTCRCGAEFCYVCGARWRTCACTMDHLAAVKAEADRRRVQRTAREAEEEAELREMLRQIEEFEREEGLKAELLRQEQERIAEEKRQRELEERIRREQARRVEVAARFQELRASFEEIHDLQRSMANDDHAREEKQLSEENIGNLSNLKEQHERQRSLIVATAESKLQIHKASMETEYTLRVAEERHLEDEYASQLKLYWTGKPKGQESLEASLREFKIKMDQGFKSWRKWMETELETYSWEVHEEQAIQTELLMNEERKLQESGRAATTAYMQRRAGQLRWIDVVINERDIMLREMEAGEMNNGEDIDAWFAEAALYTGSAGANGVGNGESPTSSAPTVPPRDVPEAPADSSVKSFETARSEVSRTEFTLASNTPSNEFVHDINSRLNGTGYEENAGPVRSTRIHTASTIGTPENTCTDIVGMPGSFVH